jgi:DNA-binding response OmpR family regulator
MAKTMPARLLVVDQDTRYGEWLKHHLGVLCPESPVSVLQLTDFSRWSEELSGRDCDVLMLAASFGSSPEDPQAQGLELLRQLREKPHFPAVIAVAEDGNELTAVRALQLGAVDYLPKRLLTPERLKTSVRLALRMIEKRVARRIASLAYTSDGESRSVVLPVKLAVATDAADAADAKAAGALRPPVDVDRQSGASSPAQASGQTEAGDSADARDSTDATNSKDSKRGIVANGDSADTNHSETNRALDTKRREEAGGSADLKHRPDAGSPADTKGNADAGNSADAKRKADAGASADNKRGVDTDSSAEISRNVDMRSFADSKGSADAGHSADSKRRSESTNAADAKGTAEPAQSTKQSTESLTPLPAAKAPGGEFMPANFIPGYTIHATIGESEKAAVYVATSAALNENVALKVSKTLRDEVAGRQFLEREYTAIVAIRDPSVVQIYDYGVHAGYEYLVMEYLPRGDLKARMQQPLTEQEALRYVAQIAAALQVVHHAGLLHRDLKPPNVMLRENGDVALIDFGLARALDGSTPSTRTGVLRGSPYYMSPEQAMGEILDARSDFYSLGIMYYEMLTGKKPYTGGSAMDVLQQHVNAPLPMLPKSLVQHEPLLLKLLAKSREDRFASAEDILVAIAARREIERAAARPSIQVESSAA